MPAAWTGERIRTARLLYGVSQADLAHAVDFSQALISGVEAGTKTCTEQLVTAVAGALDMPMHFFEVPAADVPAGTLRHRKLASAKATDTKRAEALLGEAFRVVSELRAREQMRAPSLTQATESEPVDIEEVAATTRLELGLSPDGPVAHVTRRCEMAGIPVVPLNLPSSDGHESETVGHFGASCWPSAHESAVIGLFPGGAGDRQRFTLAHELGHLILHSRRRNVADAEDEANRFAGALLIPPDRMREALESEPVTLRGLAQMKARWGVSIQALIMRGAHLGLIDDQRTRSLFKQLSARGWRKNEPVPVGLEQPALLWELLTRRYGANPYSAAADDLGLPAMLLRGLAPKPTQAPSGR